jgi:hypothetical protein
MNMQDMLDTLGKRWVVVGMDLGRKLPFRGLATTIKVEFCKNEKEAYRALANIQGQGHAPSFVAQVDHWSDWYLDESDAPGGPEYRGEFELPTLTGEVLGRVVTDLTSPIDRQPPAPDRRGGSDRRRDILGSRRDTTPDIERGPMSRARADTDPGQT